MIMENAVLDAIKGRRSIRKYKAEQITDDELQTVLEAGTYAPTGKISSLRSLWQSSPRNLSGVL